MTSSGREPVVEFSHARIVVAGRMIWRDLTVDIGAGEFTAILGPNGAGKTTLVRAALGLVPLAGGSVRVLGKRAGEAADRIGYLPQRRRFDPALHARGTDIVRLGLDGTRWGVPLPDLFVGTRERNRRRRVEEVIDLVGATAFATRPIGELSGGEQQRILIAQALVPRPRLLFLDEPLDSLDLPNQASIASLLHRVSAHEGVTIVIVAHDVNPILPYLDRVVYLGHGDAVAGEPHAVITKESLTRLFQTPIEVITTADGRLVVVGLPDAPALHSDRHAHEHGGPRGQ